MEVPIDTDPLILDNPGVDSPAAEDRLCVPLAPPGRGVRDASEDDGFESFVDGEGI
jgi:hypothetical protein